MNTPVLEGCLDVDVSLSYFPLYFIIAVYVSVHRASTRRITVGNTSAVLTDGAWPRGARHPASTRLSQSILIPYKLCRQIFVSQTGMPAGLFVLRCTIFRTFACSRFGQAVAGRKIVGANAFESPIKGGCKLYSVPKRTYLAGEGFGLHFWPRLMSESSLGP